MLVKILIIYKIWLLLELYGGVSRGDLETDVETGFSINIEFKWSKDIK